MGKSILLGDIIPTGLVPEVNGLKAKVSSLPAQNVHVKAVKEEINHESENRSQILSFGKSGILHEYKFKFFHFIE